MLVGVAAVLGACSEHKVDTFPEWCEQITGVDLAEEHRPWWAVIFTISYDGDAIRDDYVAHMNSLHMEKVQNRAPRMVWRENTNLHIVNLSSFLEIEPEKFIAQWRDAIEMAKTDHAGICVLGTVTSMFDNLYIHSMTPDALGVEWKDSVTTIPTEREVRLGEKRL